jgi:hypothetical protein
VEEGAEGAGVGVEGAEGAEEGVGAEEGAGVDGVVADVAVAVLRRKFDAS